MLKISKFIYNLNEKLTEGIAGKAGEVREIEWKSKAAHDTIRRKEGKTVMEKTYKERYLANEIPFEAIDDYSYEWGMGEDSRTLCQYLGLNAEEEDAWVSVGEEALQELLDAQKK